MRLVVRGAMTKMKRIAIAFLASCLFAACSLNEIPVQSVQVNQSAMHLNPGQSGRLYAIIIPSLARNQNITWSSDNPSIAGVDSGAVYSYAVGTAHITVTTADGGKTATCIVTVDTNPP